MNESIRARLPHASEDGSGTGAPPPGATWQAVSADPAPGAWRAGCLPTFWTVASVLSMIVNVILILIVLGVLFMLGRRQELESQAAAKIGDLYTSFVQMDQASIRTSIHVEKEIPVNFTLNVTGPTNVTLSQPVRITGARVWVRTGGLTIDNAEATILLPAGVVLPIGIDSLVVPVDQKVPAVLDVPVDIPLSQTELHEPFVGLREIVQPFHCFFQPDTTLNGIRVCD